MRFDASRTASSAQSPLRPFSSVTPRSEAAASLTAFLRASFGMSAPPTWIGVEEPMFVAGAIARTSAASPIQTPAEAARDPLGET